ncbi:MAG: ATPase, T2SS/T4P/T4SS family [Euryarchaeota archaeon]|nr:ATPase, T2SS/T4P/T4SS family [Euryarchaeota archaeon]
MKKDSKVGNKKSSFSSNEDKDASEMEREIDEILSGDKNKLNEIDLKDSNKEKILPKIEEKKFVPLIKEKLKENVDDSEKPEIPNEKIIAELKETLDEEPLKVDENVEESDEQSEKKRSKMHIGFGKKKEKSNEDISDKQPTEGKTKYEEKINQPSSDQDNLDDLKKKYEGHISFSGMSSTQTNDTRFLDKKIGETFPSENEADSDKTDRKTKTDEHKKKKISLWGKRSSKLKDNEDEASSISGKEEKKDSVERKALKFAEEHIKDDLIAEKTEENSKSIEDELSGEKHSEHVFFDESVESEGWSPSLTEQERKDLSLSFSARPEIKSEDIHPEIKSGDAKENDEIELPKEVLQTKSIKLADLGFSENEWEELDFYPLEEHFAYVEILREKDSLDKRYFLVEVELTSEEQKTLDFITETISNLGIDAAELDVQGKDKYLMTKVRQVIKEYGIKIDNESFNKIIYHLEKMAIGLERIDPLMKDPNIEDISCDGANVPLFLYHRTYGSLKSNVEFKSEDELSSFVFKLAQKCGKHISIAEPMLDATMPDGSRIQMTLSDEITARGSTFTIRKFREDPFSPPDLVEFNTMSAEMVAYMWIAVENGINALIAGGTAAGKTTILNALSLFIPREAKIVSIEETREINLPHPNWIPGVARSGFGEVVADKIVGEIDMYDLMKAALRQRPEYIIVGEIRGKEAYVLFQAMATGHATYSTVHADSAQSLIHRLEGKPINIPRVMLQSLDIVSLHVITRVKNKRARRCKQIIEIIDIDPTTKEILTNEVFRWDPIEDNFIYSGKSYVLERIRTEKDMSREEMTNELRNRTRIIEWMNVKNVREFRGVANLVSRYAENPVEVMKQIEEENKQ